MNRSAYLEKCLTLINTSHFHKLTEDPTRPTEDKYKDLQGNVNRKYNQIFTRKFTLKFLHQVNSMGLLISTNYQKITTKTYCTRHCYCSLPFIEIIRQFFVPIKLIRVDY